MNKKRRYFSFILLLLAVLLFAGCAKKAEPTGTGEAEGKIGYTDDADRYDGDADDRWGDDDRYDEDADGRGDDDDRYDDADDRRDDDNRYDDAEDGRDDDDRYDDADDRGDNDHRAASSSSGSATIDVDGSYTSKEDVALYLHIYGELPKNFVTKKEARAAGWDGGFLEPYFPGCCIGGDRFGNYEGLLPEDDRYFECDIDTLGARSRGSKRIVYSDDGDIYYTEDHYKSFTRLYDD